MVRSLRYIFPRKSPIIYILLWSVVSVGDKLKKEDPQSTDKKQAEVEPTGTVEMPKRTDNTSDSDDGDAANGADTDCLMQGDSNPEDKSEAIDSKIAST